MNYCYKGSVDNFSFVIFFILSFWLLFFCNLFNVLIYRKEETMDKIESLTCTVKRKKIFFFFMNGANNKKDLTSL